MSANLVALSRMATGRVAEAVPVFEDLMARVPDMSFPVANLLRAQAFLEDWAAVDRLDPAARHPLREFQDGLAFIQTKRDPTPENIGAIRDALAAHCTRTGCVDVSRLVYAAHLGLVEEAYGRPRPPASVRVAPKTTSWVQTATAPGCCSTLECPNCATIRASCPCARASASSNSGWRLANGPTAG